jgi:outer membrane lipoprotein SlyB
MARTTANAEYNAAALVRNRAITDETQALIVATKAAALAGVGEGGAGAPAMGRGNGLLRFVGLVAAFVVGVAVEFFWYRAHYLPHVVGHG